MMTRKESPMAEKLRLMKAEALRTGELKIGQKALGYEEVCQYIGTTGGRPSKYSLNELRFIVNLNNALSYQPCFRGVCVGMEEAIRDGGCEIYEDPDINGLQVRYVGAKSAKKADEKKS